MNFCLLKIYENALKQAFSSTSHVYTSPAVKSSEWNLFGSYFRVAAGPADRFFFLTFPTVQSNFIPWGPWDYVPQPFIKSHTVPQSNNAILVKYGLLIFHPPHTLYPLPLRQESKRGNGPLRLLLSSSACSGKVLHLWLACLPSVELQ